MGNLECTNSGPIQERRLWRADVQRRRLPAKGPVVKVPNPSRHCHESYRPMSGNLARVNSTYGGCIKWTSETVSKSNGRNAVQYDAPKISPHLRSTRRIRPATYHHAKHRKFHFPMQLFFICSKIPPKFLTPFYSLRRRNST